MSEQESGKSIPGDDQLAVELRSAVHAGDIEAIKRLLRNDPALASARLGSKDSGTTTPLHLVTDWPGYFPNGPQIVRLLIGKGADPNARTTSRGSEATGPGDETPLHYAASSDDVDVAEALIDGGADIEVPDGSIGAPLDNAVGYACWHVARLLAARGARVDKAWHGTPLDAASGLGTRQENVISWLRELGAGPASSD
jgi:ankyrin repeat protein